MFQRVFGPVLLAASVLFPASSDGGFWVDPDVVGGGHLGSDSVVQGWDVDLFSDEAALVSERVAAQRDARAAGRWDALFEEPVHLLPPAEGAAVDRMVEVGLFDEPLRVGAPLWEVAETDGGLPVGLFVGVLAGAAVVGLGGALVLRRARVTHADDLIGDSA